MRFTTRNRLTLPSLLLCLLASLLSPSLGEAAAKGRFLWKHKG
jgi:hypothetical protein